MNKITFSNVADEAWINKLSKGLLAIGFCAVH